MLPAPRDHILTSMGRNKSKGGSMQGRHAMIGFVTVMLMGVQAQADVPSLQPAADEEIKVYSQEVLTSKVMLDRVYTWNDAQSYVAERRMDLVDDKLGQAEVALDKIINMGNKVWAVIAKNQPVVNIQYAYANALPEGVRGAGDLDGFSELQYRTYRYWGKNPYGMTVFDVTYTVVHRYGGQYNGQGRYIEAAAVLPQDVSVLWGYTLGLSVEKVSTVNVGTAAAPVASLGLELAIEVSTVIKKSRVRRLFEVRGDSARAREIGI